MQERIRLDKAGMQGRLTAFCVVFASALLFAQDASLRYRDWSTLASTTVRPTQEADGVGFPLPAWPQNVGYAWTGIQGPLTGSFHIALRVEMTGAPIFRWDTEPSNTCWGVPSTVRPFILRWGKGKKDIGFANRWWSNPTAFVLGGSGWSADIPLDPMLWTGVYGQFAFDDMANWQADLDGAQAIGVTFGGGCFFGHGVGVENGSAKVVITALSVN